MWNTCQQTDVPFAAPRTLQSGCHFPQVKGTRLALTHHLFCFCWEHWTEQIDLKEQSLCFTPTSHKRCLSIWFVFTEVLSPLLNQGSFSGKAVCECQAPQLNKQQIGSGCLSHVDAHYQFSRLVERERGERRMSGQRQMKRLYDMERNRCCLCCRCVCAARSLCRICIMRSASPLGCVPLRGVPVVASSRSLFTKAFLFSSRSWLGMRPALPPSMWQACDGNTHVHTDTEE